MALNIIALFSVDNVPLAGSPRAWYSYKSFRTSLARAKVWFSKPRRAIDLDYFLEGKEFALIDASYLCYYKHCVVHLIYEKANVNQDRNNCQRRARFLRAKRKPILEECSKHNPLYIIQASPSLALALAF